MIPKIIHFCWLSKDPFPKEVQKYIMTWKKFLPDYKIMHWNFDNFDVSSSIWVKQAFDAKKYAFASDYIRLFALYKYGGIYFDTDVEVIKNFDPLRTLPYFIGKENTIFGIEAATIGACIGNEWIKKCLEYYNDRSFILEDGTYDMRPLPSIIKEVLESNYELIDAKTIAEVRSDQNKIYILPSSFFSPKKWDNAAFDVRGKETYSIHHFNASWKDKNSRKRLKIDRFIQKHFGYRFFLIYRKVVNRLKINI